MSKETGVEIFAVERDGMRLLHERPEEVKVGMRYQIIGEIKQQVGILETSGWRMGVALAQEAVRSGLCNNAVVELQRGRNGARDRVAVYEKWEDKRSGMDD